jgi:hypothetical protein
MSQESNRRPISDHLSGALERLDQMQALRESEDQDTKKQQINLRLTGANLRALEKIADHYDDNRTSVATLLLQAAITDACERLGIDWMLYTREELEAQGFKVTVKE